MISPTMLQYAQKRSTQFGQQFVLVLAFVALIVTLMPGPRRWTLPLTFTTSEAQYALQDQWLADFLQSGYDYSTLPQQQGWGLSARGPASLEASVADADLIVVGRVIGVDFLDTQYGLGMGSLLVEDTIKGEASSEAFRFPLSFRPTPIVQTNVSDRARLTEKAAASTPWSEPQPALQKASRSWYESGKGVLTMSGFQPIIRPGDRVIAVLWKSGDARYGDYFPQPEAGLYRIEDGKIEAGTGNDFHDEVNGLPLEDFLGRLSELSAAHP
jgi:hypothetical protein